MAVSFLSGKVVYVSPQGSSVLRCKPERLQGTMFSELLAPQDISTFYSGTAPCRLPLWASCIGSGEPAVHTGASARSCRDQSAIFFSFFFDRPPLLLPLSLARDGLH